MITVKSSTVLKLMEGILSSIERNDNLAGTTVDVTPKQYDEIVKYRKFYKAVFGNTDLEMVTGYKVTAINGFCKKMPLLGTKVMVNLKKVVECPNVDVTESVTST